MRKVWEQYFAPPPTRMETIVIGYRIICFFAVAAGLSYYVIHVES